MKMKDKSNPDYKKHAELVRQFDAEYGEDWDSTRIEYGNDFVDLPQYVGAAAYEGNIRTVIQWLGKGSIQERVNAKCEDAGNAGLLYVAATGQQHDFMSYLLLNGADVNTLNASGASVLSSVSVNRGGNNLTAVRLLLGWGAELFRIGKQMTKEWKLSWCDLFPREADTAVAKLVSPELGGRRCEIVSAPNTRGDLVGKTCVVEDYIEKSDRYKVRMEFTNEELLLGAEHLKRRDRTSKDPGYYVEYKNNRLIRRDFESNEECQAFVANRSAQKEEWLEIDPDAKDKAEQAAADLLAELGLEDLEGPSVEESNKKKQSSGKKKKKRVVKKKGRK